MRSIFEGIAKDVPVFGAQVARPHEPDRVLPGVGAEGPGDVGYPTTNVGTLPPPALTLMTELREARVTAPTSAPAA